VKLDFNKKVRDPRRIHAFLRVSDIRGNAVTKAPTTLPSGGSVRAAKIIFLVAGISGLISVFPLYFSEQRIARDYPPAITHPEFFYGFIGVTLAWQVAFLLIGMDPVRFQPLIAAALIEKYGFGIAAVLLYLANRIQTTTLIFGFIDLAWGVLFVICYVRLARA
jgi:hypothetical protein